MEISFCLTVLSQTRNHLIQSMETCLVRHSLTDCLIASSLPFSSTDYIPFVITVSPTCSSSAHFKTANSKAFFLLCAWFAAVFQVQTRPVLALAS